MEFFYTLVIGLIVGIIAKFLLPGKDPGGLIITTLIGIAGAMITKYVGQTLKWYEPGESAGFIGSVLGAIALLVVYRMVKKPSTK